MDDLHNTTGQIPGLIPSFSLNDFSLQLPLASSTPHPLAPPVPRVPIPPKRTPKLVRPSTASAIEEKASVLPSLPNGSNIEVPTPDHSASKGVNANISVASVVRVASVQQLKSHPPLLGGLPSPFERQGSEEISNVSEEDISADITEYSYDWATFMSAYAAGQWDPHRTPNPPRSFMSLQPHLLYPQSAQSDLQAWTVIAANEGVAKKQGSTSHQPNTIAVQLPTTNEANVVVATRSKRPTLPLKLPSMIAHPMRNSISDIRHDPEVTMYPSNPEVATTAATMRWAAARVNIAPLALPSPEHELTDPMRGVTAVIPGSRKDGTEPILSGGSRKTRLSSFWEGTQDIEDTRSDRSSTIEDNSVNQNYKPEYLQRPAMPLPASAPLVRTVDDSGDYFAGVDDASSEETFLSPHESPTLVRRGSSPLEAGTLSVPVAPRRVILTRQRSSPLPETVNVDQISPARVIANSNASFKATRAAKEEQMYSELGYLAPPHPPDEWERRRALNKFNIWSTGPDLNFDRIAHLTKLVFNTKGVFVSLVDGNEQWFKSQSDFAGGMKVNTCGRVHAFCAHAILQRGDEPMVILDTHTDWRFTKHPLVVGSPNIRFYAGAPLRTQDGYNIGTLSVIDDSARDDFSPRQRHTLKEFAAIAMRELELWRDKIQLRIRDRIQTSMEQFSRECLEIETEVGEKQDLTVGASMERVYDRAAKLVKRTLDVEGVIVMDVSHCEVLETTSAEGAVSVVIHHGDPHQEATSRSLSQDEYAKLTDFFSVHPDGKISEGIVPPCFRPFLPTHIHYALTVPIFNIDKRPFALLCAYNGADHANRFLEGHELSYLRAIGVIILSAVLKRRMILADKAKSLFISNISHELRTPLHGILAAAELLTDTTLDANQTSFLQTVQACGTSLVETVNHVLDFTKLSGNSKSGGVEHVIVPSHVDLMQLVEEAIDTSVVGHHARMSVQNSEIGSVYSPPTTQQISNRTTSATPHVETILEIGPQGKSWLFNCEKGGIRRVLMNLLGNSLKFTSDGYVHVSLKQTPISNNVNEKMTKIELSVLDTGKGISQNFLRNQLFHPFSQENPLQTGTGLGLAIVNSIVQSDSVGGKVEVWSEEGVGTEIKIIFVAEAIQEDSEGTSPGSMDRFSFDEPTRPPTVSLVGFDTSHKGVERLRAVISGYLVSWWGFVVQQTGDNSGDIIVVNEDPTFVEIANRRRDTSRPFIILSGSRGDARVMAIASEHERIGGFCRVIFKPGGPSRFFSVVKTCVAILKTKRWDTRPSVVLGGGESKLNPTIDVDSAVRLPQLQPQDLPPSPLDRTGSQMHLESEKPTVRIPGSKKPLSTIPPAMDLDKSTHQPGAGDPTLVMNASNSPTIPVGDGSASLLKSSVGTIRTSDRRYSILVVEDNHILRKLLVQWLKSRGHEIHEATDGQDGVHIFESEGAFDIVLLDMSMPNLDGIGATTQIRQIESARRERNGPTDRDRANILALTGMSSLEDKRKAFAVGVDGYLVKPVKFQTIDEIFQRLSVDHHTS